VAGYSIYEVLRTLVERVGWPNEAERVVVLESIAEAERVSLFGNMATLIECQHVRTEQKSWKDNVKCVDCGRILI
jgi:hypothetical protein